MNKCKQCGANVGNSLKFCVSCGAKIKKKEISPNHKICFECGRKMPKDLKFCTFCGASLISYQNKEKYIPINNPVPNRINTNYNHLLVNRKKRKLPLIAAIVTVFMVLVVGWFLLDLDSDKELTANGQKNRKVKLSATPIEVSNSKEFEITPLKGITISAEENAMDKDRKIDFYELSDIKRNEVGEIFLKKKMVVLKAYEFDAGMQSDEIIPGVMKIEIDLKKIGIDEKLYQFIDIARLGDDGKYEILTSELKGSVLVCYTNKNSFLAVGIGLFSGSIVRGAMLYDEEITERNLSAFPAYKNKKIISTNILKDYNIFWPEDMGHANPTEVKKRELQLKNALGKYGVTDIEELYDNLKSYDFEGASRISKILSDPEVSKVLTMTNDINWQMDNYWPSEVKFTINALKQADNYLFKVRKFKKPTHVVDVGVLKPWPHSGSDMGISKNPYTGRPYLHINATIDFNNYLDDFYVTVTHELFHIAQTRYVWIDWNSHTWFWEATARVLESEAAKYYLKNKIIKKINMLTYRDYFKLWTYSYGMPEKWKNVEAINDMYIHYGYSSSYFLEYIKDAYYKSNPDIFLPSLLNRYSRNHDIHTILKEISSNDTAAYDMDFIDFNLKMESEILPRLGSEYKKITITDASQVEEIPIKNSPKSIDLANIEIAYNDVKYGKEDVLLVFKVPKHEKLMDQSIMLRFNKGNRGKYTALKPYELTVIKGIDNLYINSIHQIHAYTEDINLSKNDNVIKAFLMIKPDKPKVEIDNDKNKLIVSLPPKSQLFDEGLVEKYLVTVKSENDKVIMKQTNKERIEIDLEDLGDADEATKSISKDLNIDMDSLMRASKVLKKAGGIEEKSEYMVTVCEMTSSDLKVITGPESDIAGIEDIGSNTSKVNIFGTWTGKIAFTNEKVTATISQGRDGYDYTLELSMYPDMEFLGNDNGDGTCSFGLNGVGKGFDFSIIKNSENELYMTAPPITFRR